MKPETCLNVSLLEIKPARADNSGSTPTRAIKLDYPLFGLPQPAIAKSNKGTTGTLASFQVNSAPLCF